MAKPRKTQYKIPPSFLRKADQGGLPDQPLLVFLRSGQQTTNFEASYMRTDGEWNRQ